MFRSTVVFVTLLLFSCSFAVAQDTKVVEPQTIGVIYHLNPSSQMLAELERQTAKTKTKVRALGFGGAKSVAEIKGEQSTLRLKSGPKPEFVVQLANGVDPNKIQLYLFEVKDGKRQVLVGSATMFGGKSGPGPIKVNVTRHGQYSYKFSPVDDLIPGEYGFNAGDSNDVFSFAVDPPQ